MDVAGEDILCIRQNCSCVVCEYDLDLGTAVADKVGVVFYVVYAREPVDIVAEELAVALECEDVPVGVDSFGVKSVPRYEVVADLVGGVAEHEDYFLCAFCNAAKTDCKAVAAENREDYAYCAALEFCFYVRGYVVDGCVVVLRACHDGLGYRDDVAVLERYVLNFRRFKHGLRYNLGEVVAASDNGRTYSAYDRSNHSFHG